MKNLNFKKVLGFLAVITILVTSAVFYNDARSSALDNVSGYGWSADWVDLNSNSVQDLPDEETGGMGWLSFNCTTGGDCGNIDYGVNIGVDGSLVGYAWSSNYGWVKFGGFDPNEFPTGGGTVAENAKLNFSTGVVTGWARFCSVAANPVLCNGSIENIKRGGWDGWLSLDGTNYTVTCDAACQAGGSFSGYAWGGNDGGKNVVGWVDFSDVEHNPISAPTVTISANPINVPLNGTTTLSWSGVGLETSADGCVASGSGPGGWPGNRPSPSGSFTTTALSPVGVYTYTITCDGEFGGTATASVDVNVGGATSLSFYALPSPSYPPYTTTLHWDAVGGTLSNCEADSASPLNIAELPDWNTTTFVANPSSQQTVNVPYNPTNYKLTCDDQFGNPVSETISVPRGAPTESVALSSNGISGSSPNFTTTISWTTVNVVNNSCNATSNASIPSWNNPNPKNPTSSGSQAGVVVPEIAPAFTTYTLTCTGFYSGNPISVSILLNEDSGNVSNKKQPIYKER